MMDGKNICAPYRFTYYTQLIESTTYERTTYASHDTVVMSNACNSTDDDDHDPGKLFTSTRDLGPQAVISVALGLFAFLTFCVCGVNETSKVQVLTSVLDPSNTVD